jgi:glycosyltransferase involved in cell wall biosynthesis
VSASSESPVLSVGLPVYNGERYLREAIDSVLAQSFTDYELLIVDNASTDATAAIAAEYAARDPRVRVHRNPENIGAARNFNLAFSLSCGRYYKWVAHDDRMHPEFLERCVSALADDPGAVLAAPRTRVIDADGELIADHPHTLATDAPSAAVRLAATLEEHKCQEIFGVMRREALEQTRLIGLHAHGDGVLLAHLAMLGRFIDIPEWMHYAREHPEQSMRMIGNYWSYAQWFNPALSGKLTFPHWRMFGEYLRTILSARAPVRDRLACLVPLGQVLGERWPLLRGDILFHLRPRLIAIGVPERLLRRSDPGAGSSVA